MILLKNKDKKANIKSGNNIEIKDSNDFPFDLTLYGKSTQATRSGKNLFTKQGNATPTTDTTFWNIITNTTPESNGWCKVSADNTSGTSSIFANQMIKRNAIDKLEVNTMYSILVEVRNLTMPGSGSTPPYLQLCETAKNSVWQSTQNYDLTIFKETNKAVFQMLTKTNFDSSTMDFRNFVSVPKGYKVEFEYRLMVVKGSYTLDTIGEYEPYGVMPSPDFPSPIESVGRKNLFDGIFELGIINGDTGKNFANNSYVRNKNYIPVEELTNYKFSSIDYTGSINVYEYKTDFSYNLTTNKQIALSSYLTTNKDTKYIRFRPTSATTNLNLRFQLEKGIVATDYVPYEHIEISATVTGKNLINPNLPVNSKTQNGITITNNGDGTYTATGTSTSSLTISLTQPNTIKLNKNTSYTNSIEILEGNFLGAIVVAVLDSEDKITYNYINVSSSSLSNTKTPTEDLTIKAYEYYINKANITVNFKFRVQLEEGTVATDYEEYKSNSLAIDLQGNELCSLPIRTKDEVNITNGEVLLNKKISKVTLNGSENWKLYSNKTHTFALSMGQTIDKHDRAYCTHFTEISSNKFDVATGIYSAYTSAIIISYLDCDTVDEFKTWLSTHNVEVLYELAEPEEIDLGTVEMPHTYDGVSYITNSADTEMVVKYYKNFEFDKILRSGYNIDEQEYEIAKKQMANGKRKKILSSYIDCIIKINLGLLDNKTYQEYKEQLEDGEYEYWSYKYNQYKKANFILTKPSITTEYAYDDDIGIDDIEITLEKSSDVS